MDGVAVALRAAEGLEGVPCVLSRALKHLEVLLMARERSMDPRLVTRDIASLAFALLTSRDRLKRNRAEFFTRYYQIRGCPQEGVHRLGWDYYYSRSMEVRQPIYWYELVRIGIYGYAWVCMGIHGYMQDTECIQWVCMGINGCAGVHVGMYGYTWVCEDSYWKLCVLLGMHGLMWVWLGVHGYLWVGVARLVYSCTRTGVYGHTWV